MRSGSGSGIEGLWRGGCGAAALLLALGLLPLLPRMAGAEVPFPSCESVGCDDPTDYGAYLKNDPANVLDPPTPADRRPDDFDPAGGDAWKFLDGTGMDVIGAWGITTGRPDAVVSVLDSGILWNEPDLHHKVALNTDELPLPQGCPAPVSPHQDPFDCNGDGVVNVSDFAGQSCPGGVVADANGNGALDAQDLILLCSDGVDGWGQGASPVANGFVDDIAGWDFFQGDNDPFDDVDAGHGTGEAKDSTGEADNGAGSPGVAPSSMFLPLRVGDHFVANDSDFAQAVVYAVDRGVSVVQEALGTINQSRFGQAAVDYAYAHGVPVIASAADEESRHHNYPANFEHTIWVNSIRDGDGTIAEAADPQSYDLLNGCTNYGGRAWTAISSASCSSEATGRGAGLALLLVSHGKNLVDAGLLDAWDPARGVPFSAEEVRQLFRASAQDIDHSGDLELSIDPLIQGFLSGPTPELAFGSSRFPTQEGWDQYTGFGRPDAVRLLEQVEEGIPPEADLSGGPDWFAVVDPARTPKVRLRGSASAARAGGWFEYSLQVGCGVQPTSYTEIRSGHRMVPMRNRKLAKWRPARTAAACGFDPGETIDDPDAHSVTLRLVVTDRFGRQGIDRRTVAIHSDPTLHFPPRSLGASGEASPALADVDRDGVLDLVYGTGDGSVHALSGDTGEDLPGFPAHTDPLPVHPSPAFDSGAVALPFESILAAVAADDLDGDGRVEIVAASAEGKVYVFDDHGRARAGFPVASDPALSRPADRDRFNDADPGFFAGPTLADLDGQPGLEIVASCADGHVYAWRADGSSLDGFPVRVADRARYDIDPVTGKATPIAGQPVKERPRKLVGSPAVGDLDGDGTPEIVVTSNEEYGDGQGFVTDSILLQILLSGAVGVGDEFDVDTTGRVYALYADGNAHAGGPFLPGWPAHVPMLVSGLLPNVATGVSGSPALADLDPGDGSPGLAVAIFGSAGPALVLGPDGRALLGGSVDKPSALAADFPNGGFVTAVPDSAGSKDAPFIPALGSGAFGDLNGDGLPEYVAPTGGIRKLIDVAASGSQHFGDHQITAWDPRTGALLGASASEPAFPAVMDDMQFIASPALADVDGDGEAEIVQGSGAYLVRAYRADGSMPEGWPKFTHGWHISSPAVGDVDGDGLLEVAALTREGMLFVWDTPAPAPGGVQWQGFARDSRNSGNWSADVSLEAAPASAADGLLWALEALRLDLPSHKGLPIARFALDAAIYLLEQGEPALAADFLPWVEFGLRPGFFRHSKAVAGLHERFLVSLRRAAERALAGASCDAGDAHCERALRKARRRLLTGDWAHALHRDGAAASYWVEAFARASSL